MIVCDAETINGIGGGMVGRRYRGVPRAIVSVYFHDRYRMGMKRYKTELVDNLRGVGIHDGRMWIREGGDFLVIVFVVAGFLPPVVFVFNHLHSMH
jgi:hypothetical protein